MVRYETYARTIKDFESKDQRQVLELKYLADNEIELTLFVAERFVRTWTKSEDDARRIIQNGNWKKVEPVRRVTA